MSEGTHENVNGKPVAIEGPGRYAVYQAPDGSWVVARATGICETCQNCGCGEQAEPIVVPQMVVALASSGGFSLDMLNPLKLRKMLKAASNGG